MHTGKPLERASPRRAGEGGADQTGAPPSAPASPPPLRPPPPSQHQHVMQVRPASPLAPPHPGQVGEPGRAVEAEQALEERGEGHLEKLTAVVPADERWGFQGFAHAMPHHGTGTWPGRAAHLLPRWDSMAWQVATRGVAATTQRPPTPRSPATSPQALSMTMRKLDQAPNMTSMTAPVDGEALLHGRTGTGNGRPGPVQDGPQPRGGAGIPVPVHRNACWWAARRAVHIMPSCSRMSREDAWGICDAWLVRRGGGCLLASTPGAVGFEKSERQRVPHRHACTQSN